MNVAQRFKHSGGFDRLFRLFADKYRSYGSFGRVVLQNPTKEEWVAISGFMGKHLKKTDCGKSISVSASQFEKALATSNVNGIELKSLIEAVLGIDLVTKRNEAEETSQRQKAFLLKMKKVVTVPNALYIVDSLLEGSPETAPLLAQYKKDINQFEALFPSVIEAVQLLPLDPPLRLPVFASSRLYDPHAFDEGTVRCSYLLDCLLTLTQNNALKEKSKSMLRAEEAAELFMEYGIMMDDLTNKVSVVGINGTQNDGMVCRKLEGAWNGRVFTDLSLRDVIKLKRAEPVYGKAVYVVENPPVFSAILDHWEGKEKIPAVICTAGNLKISAYRLIDTLVTSNPDLSIYFSADFDPEGILMLQRLYDRHPSRVLPWRFSVNDYFKTNPIKDIEAERRVNMLRKSMVPGMEATVEAMKNLGKAGYQEELILDLLGDLEQSII